MDIYILNVAHVLDECDKADEREFWPVMTDPDYCSEGVEVRRRVRTECNLGQRRLDGFGRSVKVVAVERHVSIRGVRCRRRRRKQSTLGTGDRGRARTLIK